MSSYYSWHAKNLLKSVKPFSLVFILKQTKKVLNNGMLGYDYNIGGIRFSSASAMFDNRNINRTENHKPKYNCAFCPYSTNNRSSHDSHERIHTGERPHKCNVCGRGFVQAIVLKRHQLIHTGEKPFSCNFCRKTFRHACTLARHEKIH